MEQIFTAVTISVFIMMGSTLFIMIWELIDNDKEWKIDLGEELDRTIVDFIDMDDKDAIKSFLEKLVMGHLKDNEK